MRSRPAISMNTRILRLSLTGSAERCLVINVANKDPHVSVGKMFSVFTLGLLRIRVKMGSLRLKTSAWLDTLLMLGSGAWHTIQHSDLFWGERRQQAPFLTSASDGNQKYKNGCIPLVMCIFLIPVSSISSIKDFFKQPLQAISSGNNNNCYYFTQFILI